ncbi:uncharacterized protein BJX67DRAFT_342998 [Aspergillus lucknowensis]|uniref:Uncharacterized protein n=1 Tax=Aspergillus lucknowensis TaxID=176173 RepID=A0ABR4M291_9EURO
MPSSIFCTHPVAPYYLICSKIVTLSPPLFFAPFFLVGNYGCTLFCPPTSRFPTPTVWTSFSAEFFSLSFWLSLAK